TSQEPVFPAQLWSCPSCKRDLCWGSDRITCSACSASYEFVGEIPDLRVPGPSWIDNIDDRSQARQLLAETGGLDYRDMVAWVFERRPNWETNRSACRIHQILVGVERFRAELRGWLEPLMKESFLEVGCGNGTLLAAAASLGCQGIGVDVSMVWLQVAASMI